MLSQLDSTPAWSPRRTWRRPRPTRCTSELARVGMPKRPLSFRVRLPPYRYPRNEWRKAIHKAAMPRLRGTLIRYLAGDRLEIEVMQGRAGGPKARRTLTRIIPNDSQIWRATVEKSAAPRQDQTAEATSLSLASAGDTDCPSPDRRERR